MIKLFFYLLLVIFTLPVSAQNLCGFWKSDQYPCVPHEVYFETFAISQNGNHVECTKIYGDPCVTAGFVSWDGEYTGSIFPVIARLGNPEDPNCCYGISSIQVLSPYHLLFDNSINVWKFSCEEVDSLGFRYSTHGLSCDCHVGTGDILIGPSPVGEHARINNNSGEDIVRIEIFSNNGQRVLMKEGNVRELQLGFLATGIYLYGIITTSGKWVSGTFSKW